MRIELEDLKDFGFKVHFDGEGEDSEIVVTYEEFFGYWIERIESKDQISLLSFGENTLSFGMVKFEDDDFTDNSIDIVFSKQICESPELMARIENLAIRYGNVALETSKNIDDKKKAYFSSLKLESLAKSAVKARSLTGKTPIFNRRLELAIADYLVTHREDIIGKVRKGKSLKRLFLLGAMILGTVVFAFLEMLWPIFESFSLIWSLGLGYGLYTVYESRKGQDSDLKEFSTSMECVISELCNREDGKTQVMDDFLDRFEEHLGNLENYMEKSWNSVDKQIVESFTRLSALYSLSLGATKMDVEVDKVALLTMLTDFEALLYGKESRQGFMRASDVKISRAEFISKLTSLGYELGMESSDSVIDAILKTLDRIYKLPYFGCEREICRLMKISIKYLSEKETTVYIPLVIIDKVWIVSESITDNINKAFAMENPNTGSTVSMDVENEKRYSI